MKKMQDIEGKKGCDSSDLIFHPLKVKDDNIGFFGFSVYDLEKKRD
ncbi:hypothetical protein H0266_15355 [Halobacillus locisalis]|uniref:Uncharacterized protein n=1 Tax=Halobacillus locisalis TaxID=220753 RepID=A0A838CWH2_9BACI|nr:hypothetical protein [Halobacillus locisalis]MBA2176274.1 hypothetical protein [Halobacillus locisalis]